MNLALIAQIIQLAEQLAALTGAGKSADVQTVEVVTQIALTAAEAVQQHTGEPIDPSKFKFEPPLEGGAA